MEKVRILGTPPSKSNSYKIITLRSKEGKTHSSLGKTAQTKAYEQNFYLQIPAKLKKANIGSDFGIIINEFFETNRNDIDNPLKIIFDTLQKANVIQNDNRCKIMLVRKYTGYKGSIDFQILPPEFLYSIDDIIRVIQEGRDLAECFPILEQMKQIYDTSK